MRQGVSAKYRRTPSVFPGWFGPPDVPLLVVFSTADELGGVPVGLLLYLHEPGGRHYVKLLGDGRVVTVTRLGVATASLELDSHMFQHKPHAS
jgi:hypothetical protein